MFSLRARVVIVLIFLTLAALAARAIQVQWWQHARWADEADHSVELTDHTETTRGRILDYRGRELAVEAPCIDAVVDYRAIEFPPDEEWVHTIARNRLRGRLGEVWLNTPRAQQKKMLEEQVTQVKADIEKMWATLGTPEVTGCSRDQVEDRRQQIVQRVQMRRRYLWYHNYLRAEKKQQQQPPPSWWKRWTTEVDNNTGPQLDSFDLVVGEQRRSHVVIPAISADLANYFTRNLDEFPGLSLQPGSHRAYPYKDAACHVLGYLTQVTREDLEDDPWKGDDLREYVPSDIRGRQGVEAMCESALRGQRGRIRTNASTGETLESLDPKPGEDVRLTIDIELQKAIEQAFLSRKRADGSADDQPLHGAAIVMDVATNEVRALVSNPTYDLNELDKTYAQLVKDRLNRPLMSRATQSQLEPGSTVKPMVGMAGITEGVVGVNEGIECKGYLWIRGKRYSVGKCWTVRRAKLAGVDCEHHTIPDADPHRGHDGNADGFLTFSDALQRSCNVYCETVADRLGVVRLNKWFGRFGLGRPTGIGLPEVSGRIPRENFGPVDQRQARLWFSGIGQSEVAATPIQMANVAATIARDGLWMRPNLVAEGWSRSATTQSSTPDRVQLPIDPEALRAAKLGMYEVVNTRGGTGPQLHRDDVVVCGKTGTAQAARLGIPKYDDNGKVVGYEYPEPSTRDHVNPLAPWYRNTGTTQADLSHAWFIGFAPAEKPQIAFAVMVEYGGGGGTVAGPVAQAVLDAAIKEGYLSTQAENR